MKTITSDIVWTAYERNLAAAQRSLRRLPFCSERLPVFRGLSGWVFEQTVCRFLEQELRSRRIKVGISEQFATKGRSKADLCVGKVLIEIKLSGIYGNASFEKYRAYRRHAKSAGLHYLFLSGEESYLPNRKLARKVFGARNTFFLDPDDEWPAFMERVVTLVGGA